MNFLRIIKEKENRIKSIPEPLTNFNFLNSSEINFHSDLFHGFDTKKNTLSLFEFNSLDDIKRIIAHSEVIRTRLENLPKEIFYIELPLTYLESLGFKPINTPIKNNVYDSLVANSHHDIKDLDNISISKLIYNLNNDIINGTLQKKSLSNILIFNAIKDNYDSKNLLLDKYATLEKVEKFFSKVAAQ